MMMETMTVMKTDVRGHRVTYTAKASELPVVVVHGEDPSPRRAILKADPPLIVTIQYDPTNAHGFFMKWEAVFDISAFGESWTDAENEFLGMLAMLWDEYAMEDDDKLSPKAQQLKARLLRRFTAVEPGGADAAKPIRAPMSKFHVKAVLDGKEYEYDCIEAENVEEAGDKVIEYINASLDEDRERMMADARSFIEYTKI